jgi:hypothetical protein
LQHNKVARFGWLIIELTRQKSHPKLRFQLEDKEVEKETHRPSLILYARTSKKRHFSTMAEASTTSNACGHQEKIIEGIMTSQLPLGIFAEGKRVTDFMN